MTFDSRSMSSRSFWFGRVLPPRALLAAIAASCVVLIGIYAGTAHADGPDVAQFDEQIRPILEDNCYACHGNGSKSGGVVLDDFGPGNARLGDRELWLAVLKNVRAGIMPPLGKPRPSAEQTRILEDWIKTRAFGIDSGNPDPGHVTVRRLNRVEYHNTIRDLIGVDFDTLVEFPPDDTGHGFDNLGEVLTLSPLLLEKYIAAARTIITAAVPTKPRTVAERSIAGGQFRTSGAPAGDHNLSGPLSLSYYRRESVATTVPIKFDGKYQLVVDLTAAERFVDGVFDLNRCKVTFKVDGRRCLSREYTRQDGRAYRDTIDVDWKAGDHVLAFEIEPLTPNEKQVRSLSIRLKSVVVRGPFDERHWVEPKDYARFFPRAVPDGEQERLDYARDLLGRFATRAFRRPVAPETVQNLANFAASIYAQKGQTFEAGIAQAMTAVLASPRFLFREESTVAKGDGPYPLIDEYALASRLSYFLWSSMPDDELFGLAASNALRANLVAQVKRMLADKRSLEFVQNFVGQWLQARDVDSVQINAFAVVSQDDVPDPEAERRRARFRELARKPAEKLTAPEKKELEEMRAAFGGSFRRFREFELSGDLRRAMRRETEMSFGHVLRDGGSVLELIDSNYAFLNERLAGVYGIAGVKGEELRRVALPADSPRGGVLTQGTVLVVTSNPDRTSPVKRGLFILDNILGTPPAPPPPDIPPLEEAARRSSNKKPTLRESLALHRQDPKCSSCHDRMDPLGLALENFNALGRWRGKERGQPIDSSGKLKTGEEFKTIQELKRILVHDRRPDYYRCLSEKLLTYALGRGLGYYDVDAVDRLVERLETTGGSGSALVMGVVESVPFQRTRRTADVAVKEAETNQPRPSGAAPGGSR
jgi:hypothetical protein